MKKNSLAFIAFAVVMLVSAFADAECNLCVYRDEKGRCVSQNCDEKGMNVMESLDDGSKVNTKLNSLDDGSKVNPKQACMYSTVPNCTNMDASCNCTSCATGYALIGGACNAVDRGPSTTTVSPVTSCPDGTKKSSDNCCCVPV